MPWEQSLRELSECCLDILMIKIQTARRKLPSKQAGNLSLEKALIEGDDDIFSSDRKTARLDL
jgi:hypothetical protein